MAGGGRVGHVVQRRTLDWQCGSGEHAPVAGAKTGGAPAAVGCETQSPNISLDETGIPSGFEHYVKQQAICH